MFTIPAGTKLYHGTDSDDFDEAVMDLAGPAWLSTSKAVAEHFARQPGGWGGPDRIVVYQLVQDLTLPELRTPADMARFSAEHNIDMCSREDIRASVLASGIEGWIIPDNYPEGDDILLASTHLLDFVDTEFL